MARRAGTLIGLLLVVAAGIVGVRFAPTNLGGHTTYVATHGTSMQPRFHSGDLAIVQPASAYHVGEIAAYHSTTLRGAVVLHRIIAIEAGHFVFKGDNNNFVDPDAPTADQVVGRLRYRIPHGGEVRAWLAKPFVLFPLLALAIGGAGSGLVRGKRRRRRRGQARAPAPPGLIRTRGPRRRLRVVVPVAAALIALGYVLAGVAVWNLPTTSAASTRAPYSQSLTIAYAATAPRGAAYPNGRVTTGQTLFTHLVRRVDLGFTYDFDSKTAHQVRGAYDVVADITSVTGWQRTLVLRPPRHFSGDRLRASATLDLATLRHIQSQFLAETGLDTTQALISIEPHVRIAGTIATAPVSSAVSTKLDFQLSAIALIPHIPDATTTAASAANGATGANGAAIAPATKNGAVTVTSTGPGGLELGSLRVPPETARVAFLVLLALGLAAFATMIAADRRRVALGEVDAITRKYGRLLVTGASIPATAERPSVQVDSMRSLARIAHLHEQLIVHSSTPTGDRFVVLTETGAFSYRAAATGRSPREFDRAVA
jgi:signal peptidase I